MATVKEWTRNKRPTESIEGSAPPRDVANLGYLVYFSLGAGFLLPWNSFITAVDYFEYLYPQQHIDRVFSVANIFPALTVLSFLTLYGQHYSSWVRINCGLAMYLVTIILVPSMDAFFIEENERGSAGTYSVTVGALILVGTGDALVQGSLIGSAGELPERYMQAVVSGTAASGVLVSVLRIITKAALPGTPKGLRQSGEVYFGVSAAFLVFCLVSFNMVHKLPVINYYQKQKVQRLNLVPSSAEAQSLTTPDDFESEVNGSDNLKLPSSAIGLSPGRKLLDKGSYWHVLGEVKWLAGSLTLIYIVTLSIFPGFLSEDVHSVFLADWYPVLLMTTYNVFDLVGKQLAGLYIPNSGSAIIGGSVGRILLIPLFASCLHGPPIFRTEAPVFLLTSLLGATNGYFTACLFIVSPKTVPLAEAETAGIIMTISLFLGFAIGSAVSWVWFV